MDYAKSIGLYLLGAAQADPKVDPFGPLMVPMAMGLLLGVVWVLRTIISPQRASLARSPGRTNHLHPVVLLGVLVLYYSVMLGVSSLWRKALNDAEATIATACVAHVSLLMLCIFIAHKTFPLGIARGLGLTGRRWRVDLLRGVLSVLIVLPVCIVLLWATHAVIEALFAGDPERIKELTRGHQMLTSLKALSWPWVIGTFISAAVLAALAEEAFFRGLVQSVARQLSGSPWVAIVMTSALFMIAHGGQIASWPALFALSVVLGYNYERTGRLLPSILVHALFNLTFLLLALFGPAQPAG
ncbi:MAG: lysostaphin resistance A-like protein [Planctomycetota bacterium]|jgi:membrane protease YdiL (CAAX protease family)